jgi:hypothetical protein
MYSESGSLHIHHCSCNRFTGVGVNVHVWGRVEEFLLNKWLQCGCTPVDAVGISWCYSTILLIFFCWIEGSWAKATVVEVSFSSNQVVKRLNFAI